MAGAYSSATGGDLYGLDAATKGTGTNPLSIGRGTSRRAGQQYAPGVGMSTYTGDNNLIGSTILPEDSNRLNTYNGYVDKSASDVANFKYDPFQSIGPFTTSASTITGRTAGQTDPTQAQSYLTRAGEQSGSANSALSDLMGFLGGGGGGAGFSYGGPGADVGNARKQTMDQLTKSLTSPDRGQLAADQLKLLTEQTQGDFDTSLRTVGQKAGALGRIGAGMTTNDLTGLAQSRDKNLDWAARDLAAEAADKTLADNIAKTNLGLGVSTGFGDSDRADAGLNLQGAQLGEQSAARIASNRLGAANSILGNDQSNRNLLRGIGNDLFGIGATNTSERGADADRLTSTDKYNTDFTYGRDRDAYDRAVNERDTSRADQYNQDKAGQTRLGTLGGLQNSQRDYEAKNRNEVRGERDFQTAQEKEAYQRALEQQQFNEWLRNSGWNRTNQAADTGFGG